MTYRSEIGIFNLKIWIWLLFDFVLTALIACCFQLDWLNQQLHKVTHKQLRQQFSQLINRQLNQQLKKKQITQLNQQFKTQVNKQVNKQVTE